MAERWNISNSALRGGLGTGGMGSGSNTGTNGVGNGTCISLAHPGGLATADGVGSSIGNGGAGISAGPHGTGSTGGTTTFSAPNGESGILRRTGHYHHHGGAPDNFDDLLVFGYSCKVFRDDERARFIDQGRHLIPWMGDNQLKIDRYDARGALHDLSPYEPPPGGYQDRLEGLTAAEQKAEQLCEEERYYSLYNNEVEEEMFQEEARKRETLLGNQIPFNYDAPLPQEGATVATVEARTSDDEQDDDPYKAPKGFDIPPDIPLPDSMKEHTVIEKTAKFIASQGGQMEILLKTKQANNPLFDFLNQSGRLFRYYRHVLLAFRTNQYPIVTEYQRDESKEATANDGNGTDGEQSESAQTRPKIVVPAIKYKPSVDCAYTQLISKITGAPIPTMIAEESSNVTADGSANAQPLTSLSTDVEYFPEGTAATVEVKKVSTGLAGLVQYDSDSGDSDEQDDGNDLAQNERNKTESAKKVQELAPFQGIVPPLNVHNVIDRTAIYVAKNGYSFEEALRAKNDARFVFLNQAHEYYPYYAYRVRQRMTAGEQPPSPPPAKVRMETENGTVVETTPSLGIKAVHTAAPKTVPAPVTNIQHQKLGAPVSFSLVRKPKDDGGGGGGGGGGTVKTMPGLGSDEDEEDDKGQKQQEASNHEQDTAGDGEPTAVKNASDGKEHDRGELLKALKEDTDSELLLDGVDVLEASSPPTSASHRSEREPTDAKEKQAERKKRANMFVNLIKHVERKVDVVVVVQERAENNSQAEKLAPPAGESISKDAVNSDVEEGSIHSVRSTSMSPKESNIKTVSSGISNEATTTTTTVIEDDDDDDVVLVSETRPKPLSPRSRSRSHADYLSDTPRSSNGRRSKKKKSKSRHRSSRVKKKSKKKSRSRSVSRSERSSSRHSRSRKRSRSRTRRGRSKSHSRSSSEDDHSSSRGDRVRRLKKSKRATRSRSSSRSRSRSRTPSYKRSRSRSRSRTKRSRKRNASSERHKRKHRSRSRSSRRNSDSDKDERSRRADRGHRRRDGHYEYDERYPPARARYWDC